MTSQRKLYERYRCKRIYNSLEDIWPSLNGINLKLEGEIQYLF